MRATFIIASIQYASIVCHSEVCVHLNGLHTIDNNNSKKITKNRTQIGRIGICQENYGGMAAISGSFESRMHKLFKGTQ